MQNNHAQPPLVNEPLYKQIERLKSEVIARNLITKEASVNTLPIHTLEEKIVLWIKSLTQVQLERPYTTLEVIRLASLKGKYRDCPALQEVAQILRKHGFEHKRNWTKASRNQRYWKFKK
jgi:hypothetical protein